jgi:hypothetical protein
MDNDERRLTLEDYGLTDPIVLEAAVRMAPALFIALHIAHRLDSSHFPIESDAAIERALDSIANDGDQFSLGGAKITRQGAKDRFPNEFLPIVDRRDLLDKVYIAIIASHRQSSREEWEKIQSGKKTLKASHPVPKEVL